MRRHPADPAPTTGHHDEDSFDLDPLLHAWHAFAHPGEVVDDPDLTLSEKRAVLASWASDACAIEAVPALRRTPSGPAVHFDDIMEALRELDRQAAAKYRPQPHYRRVLAKRRPGVFTRTKQRSDDTHGPAIN